MGWCCCWPWFELLSKALRNAEGLDQTRRRRGLHRIGSSCSRSCHRRGSAEASPRCVGLECFQLRAHLCVCRSCAGRLQDVCRARRGMMHVQQRLAHLAKLWHAPSVAGRRLRAAQHVLLQSGLSGLSGLSGQRGRASRSASCATNSGRVSSAPIASDVVRAAPVACTRRAPSRAKPLELKPS